VKASVCFYKEGVGFMQPQLKAKLNGARMFRLLGPTNIGGTMLQPVSCTTIHIFSADFYVAPLDLWNLAKWAGEQVGISPIGFYYEREMPEKDDKQDALVGDGMDSRARLRTRFMNSRGHIKTMMEPTGHVYIAFPPGNSQLFLPIVTLMDSIVFQTAATRLTEKGYMHTMSGRTAVQLSTQELAVFERDQAEWLDRRWIDGPRYYN